MKEDFKKVAYTVSIVSIIVNAILTVGKLFAGLFSHSSAMISDAIHSASDVISTFVVMIGIKFSQMEEDKDHPYGHERLECVAAIVLASMLAFVGIQLGITTFEKIFKSDSTSLEVPGTLALLMALVSILTKEAMFWYAKINAKKIDSPSLMADAWHHRSDALSSVGALFGIGMARMGYPSFDGYASIVICAFILKAALDIFKDAVEKMIDTSSSPEFEKQVHDVSAKVEGVIQIDDLKTRVFGNKIYADIEIAVDGNLKLYDAHAIAEKVHEAVEQNFPKIKHIMVHVNPR